MRIGNSRSFRCCLIKIRDRVGLGWRDEISAGIFSNFEKIDVIEVIADNYFKTNKKSIEALKFLNKQIPLSLHGVGMGLASSQSVLNMHIDKMARLVESIQPEFWSEHLAFVRAGKIEIGHLAAPPRNQKTIENAIRNISNAARIVGSLPQMENIATLIDPPASCFSEPEWVSQIILGSNAPLLLDLHNLFANAINFKQDPIEILLRMPLNKIKTVHLSGGTRWASDCSALSAFGPSNACPGTTLVATAAPLELATCTR